MRKLARSSLATLAALILASTAWGAALDEFRKGDVAGDRGEYVLAIYHYTLAIKSGELPRQKQALAYLDRGDAYLKSGIYGQAIVDYTAAIELRPELAVAFNNRAIAHYHQGQYEAAISDYDVALRLDPEAAHVIHANRGIAYLQMGRNGRAIEDFDTAIRLKPDYANAYFNRGLSYESKGLRDLAITDFRKAHSLMPSHPTIQEKMSALGLL